MSPYLFIFFRQLNINVLPAECVICRLIIMIFHNNESFIFLNAHQNTKWLDPSRQSIRISIARHQIDLKLSSWLD